MSETIAIETRELTKIYGSGNTEVVAMQNASVVIRRGEVVALLRAKRSGKIDFSHCRGANQPAHIGPDTHRRRTDHGWSDTLGQLAELSSQAHRLCFPKIESDSFPFGTGKCASGVGTERLQPSPCTASCLGTPGRTWSCGSCRIRSGDAFRWAATASCRRPSAGEPA